MEHNNVKIEHIVPFMIAGCFNARGLPAGWRIYPITYAGKKYVVEIKLDLRFLEYGIHKKMVYIYEYGEKKQWIRHHRRKQVFKKEVAAFRINEFDFILADDISDKIIRQNLPAIAKSIFQEFEKAQQSEQSGEEFTDIQWDGVVK